MDIRFKSVVKSDHRRLTGISVDPAEFFVALRVEPEAGLMRGISGRFNGQIPLVRQIILRSEFIERAVTPEAEQALVKWVIALESGSILCDLRAAPRRQGVAARASAWQSFLSGETESPDAGATLAAGIAATKQETDLLSAYGLVRMRPRETGYGVGRVAGLSRSAYISGFDALRFHVEAKKDFPEIPAPAHLHLEDARRALASIERPSAAAVAWYGIPDDDLRALRLQAAESYPILADMIAEKPSIARCVDRREPVAEAILRQTGLSKGSLKRIGKLRAKTPVDSLFEQGQRAQGADGLGVNRDHRMTISGVASRDAMIRQLAAMPPDRTPQGDAEWLQFHTILSGCAIPLANALEIPEAKILEASKGNWAALHGQLAKAADFDPSAFDRRALAVNTVDAIETVEDFSRTVLLPQVLLAIESADQPLPAVTPEHLRASFEASWKILLGGSKNIGVTMLEIARRHASRIPALMEAEGTFDDGLAAIATRRKSRFDRYGVDAFPILTEAWQASNGLMVVPLRNFGEMQEESRRLTHCVGQAYLGAARATRSHIFSVQPASRDASLSTVELSGIKDNGPALADIRIAQHRARSNGNPDPSCLRAVKEWFDLLKAGRLPTNEQEILEWRAHRALINDPEGHTRVSPQITWSSALEADWQDMEKRQNSWTEWRGIIGGAVGKPETPEGIFRMREARALLEAMSPSAAVILTRRARQEAEAAAASPAP